MKTQHSRFFAAKPQQLPACAEIKITIEEQDIPFVPRNVRIRHLTPEGMLLNPYIVAKADDELKAKPDARYPKGVGDSPFGALRLNGQNYCVYYGTRHRGAAIGEGAYGKVKSVQSRAGHWLALKVQEDEFDEEYEFLSSLERVAGPVIERQKENATRKYNLLMHYVRGINLEKLIKKYQADKIKIHPLRLLDILVQTFIKVDFLHDCYIVHVDLKPANILVDLNARSVEIVDFGLSLKMNLNKTAESSLLSGTNGFVAPELIAMDAATGKANWSPRTDAYACGRILKMLLGIADTFQEFMCVTKLCEQRAEILRKSEESENKSDEKKQTANNQPKKIDYEKEWKTAPYITITTPFSHDLELTRIAKKLTHENPDIRLRCKTAIEKLSDYRAKMKERFPVRVGILHFDHFKKLHACEKRIFLKRLKKFDEIILVNAQHYAPNQFKESAVALR